MNHPLHAPLNPRRRQLPPLRLFAVLSAFACFTCHTPSPSPIEVQSLIGSPAPDFALRDGRQQQDAALLELSTLRKTGPVVVIFHRGLQCPLCVEHLTAFAQHIDSFRNAGIQVVAIGPDTPDETRDAVASFTPIPFPLLSDPTDRIARAFNLERPDGALLHGTFLIDSRGIVRWAAASDEPVGGVSVLLSAGINCKASP